MLTRAYCEIFAKKCATAIRVAVAKELVTRYGMSQVEASRLAGIPQPLLNYVLKNKRKIRGLDQLYSTPEAVELVKSIAETLYRGKTVDMCNVCIELRRRCIAVFGGGFPAV